MRVADRRRIALLACQTQTLSEPSIKARRLWALYAALFLTRVLFLPVLNKGVCDLGKPRTILYRIQDFGGGKMFDANVLELDPNAAVLRGWIFRLFAAPAEGIGRNGLRLEDRPALPLFTGSSRRSGCVPAEPYPPLEQRCFPFPFPWGSIGWETGNRLS
jgi:hypothetical protein